MDYESFYSMVLWLDKLLMYYASDNTPVVIRRSVESKRISNDDNGFVRLVLQTNYKDLYDKGSITDIYKCNIIKPNSKKTTYTIGEDTVSFENFYIALSDEDKPTGKKSWISLVQYNSMYILVIPKSAFCNTDRKETTMCISEYLKIAIDYARRIPIGEITSFSTGEPMDSKLDLIRYYMITIIYNRITFHMEDGEIANYIAPNISEGYKKAFNEVEKILKKYDIFNSNQPMTPKEALGPKSLMDEYDNGYTTIWEDITHNDIIMTFLKSK